MKTLTTATNTQKAVKIRSLSEVNLLVREKRSADLLRFRACCCDPRASK